MTVKIQIFVILEGQFKDESPGSIRAKSYLYKVTSYKFLAVSSVVKFCVALCVCNVLVYVTSLE